MKSREYGSKLITFMPWCVTRTASYSGYGHQHCRFNEGMYLVRDNVPLGCYQCNKEAGRAPTMCDSIISTSACLLPSHVHADDSSPSQNHDTTTELHDGNQQIQQYLYALRARASEESQNPLEYVKKNVVGGLGNSNMLGLIPPPAY